MSTRQGSWTHEEDMQLLELHGIHGNKWTFISRTIGGRTDNAVKNRYHALQNKEKSKLFAKMEEVEAPSSVETTSSSDSGSSPNRCLKHFTSLERVRASTELRRQQLRNQNDGLQFANDSGTLNNYPDPSILTQTNTSSPLFFGSTPPGSWMDPWRAASQSMYPSNGSGWDPVQDLDCLLTPEGCSEDLDSLDSSSMETRQSLTSNECFSRCFLNNEENGVFSNLIGGESPTSLFGSRSIGSCDFDIKKSITRDARNYKSRGLTIDLNFSALTSGFDIDDFSQKFSPSSPSAFLKSLSPPIV